MRTTTARMYEQHVRESLDFILKYLDEPCTVEQIAAQARFSRFHYQRVFRAMTGESVTDLVRRLRIERAAHRLRHERSTVIEIALEAGYQSEEAFSRAFRRGCGMSPSRYRSVWPPPTFRSPTARVRYYPARNVLEFDPPNGSVQFEVRIETMPSIEVARIRHLGPYDEISESFMRLLDWAASVGAQTGLVFSRSHDDPGEVATQELRSDACLEVHTDAAPAHGITIERLAAGRYAVYTHHGPYDGIPEAYQRIYGLWLPANGEELDDRPCVEIYRNTPRDAAADELITDLCLPLRAGTDPS